MNASDVIFAVLAVVAVVFSYIGVYYHGKCVAYLECAKIFGIDLESERHP